MRWKPFIGIKSFTKLSVMLLITSACRSQTPETVPYVDLEKYAGLWYEIASFPARFQRGCTHTTAEYKLTSEGYVVVINRCTRDIDRTSVEGKAFIVPNTGNAKLKVQFFWPFRGHYWIIDLADDYSWAVVGNPRRTYLWILSRTPNIDDDLYNTITSRVAAKGFDINKLNRTIQVK